MMTSLENSDAENLREIQKTIENNKTSEEYKESQINWLKMGAHLSLTSDKKKTTNVICSLYWLKTK